MPPIQLNKTHLSPYLTHLQSSNSHSKSLQNCNKSECTFTLQTHDLSIPLTGANIGRSGFTPDSVGKTWFWGGDGVYLRVVNTLVVNPDASTKDNTTTTTKTNFETIAVIPENKQTQATDTPTTITQLLNNAITSAFLPLKIYTVITVNLNIKTDKFEITHESDAFKLDDLLDPVNVESYVGSVFSDALVGVLRDLISLPDYAPLPSATSAASSSDTAMSYAAFDDAPKVSKYCYTLPFNSNRKVISPDSKMWKCEYYPDVVLSDENKSNLWLNLSTGFIGGGRKNWDGSGGTGGALDYYNDMLAKGEDYPLCVKLGTINDSLSNCDCYSYASSENDIVLIPNLRDLLERLGMVLTGLVKSVSTTSEMEVSINKLYDFSSLTEADKHLVALQAPGVKGIKNLGNTCYVNSVVQCLLSGNVGEIVERYGPNTSKESKSGVNELIQGACMFGGLDAQSDVLGQVCKLVSCFVGGDMVEESERWSVDDYVKSGNAGKHTAKTAKAVEAEAEDKDEASMELKLLKAQTEKQHDLQPYMFKSTLAQNHVEFVTSQQQDASLYIRHLLDVLTKAESDGFDNGRLTNDAVSGKKSLTSDLFGIGVVEKVKCVEDGGVGFNEWAMDTMLSLIVPMEKCTLVESKDDSSGSSKEVSKEEEDESQPKKPKTEKEKEKIEPMPTLNLSDCLESWSSPALTDPRKWSHLPSPPSVGEVQLSLGNFPKYMWICIQKYTVGANWQATKLRVEVNVPEIIDLSNYKVDRSLKDGEYVIEHTGDGDDEMGGSSSGAENEFVYNESHIATLMDMGFSLNGCKRALSANANNVEESMNWIFEHSNDSDFNDDILPSNSKAASDDMDVEVNEETLATLLSYGMFTADQIKPVLKHHDDNLERSADWLFNHMDGMDAAIANLTPPVEKKGAGKAGSDEKKKKNPETVSDGNGKYELTAFISHIGSSVHSGHYVSHVRKRGENGGKDVWVLFNDDKVGVSETVPLGMGFCYLFKRMD